MQLKISSSSSSGRIYSVSVKIKPRIMHKFPEWNKLINCWVQDDAIINNSELYINLWLFAQKLQTPIRISCSIKFLTTAKIWRLQCWESWKYNFQFAFWTNYGQIRKLWLETLFTHVIWVSDTQGKKWKEFQLQAMTQTFRTTIVLIRYWC